MIQYFLFHFAIAQFCQVEQDKIEKFEYQTLGKLLTGNRIQHHEI